MSRKVIRERVNLIADGQRDLNVYLHLDNETNRGVKIPDHDLIRANEIHALRNPGGTNWTTQSIIFEDEPARATNYRLWSLEVSRLKREIAKTRCKMTKGTFDRLVARNRKVFWKRQFQGAYRTKRSYKRLIDVVNPLWVIRYDEYLRLLRNSRSFDAKALKWINLRIQEAQANPELAASEVYWEQVPGTPKPLIGRLVHPDEVSERLKARIVTVPVTKRIKVSSVAWDKVYQRWHQLLSLRDKRLKVLAAQLTRAEQQRQKYAFSSGELANRWCYQQDSTACLHVDSYPLLSVAHGRLESAKNCLAYTSFERNWSSGHCLRFERTAKTVQLINSAEVWIWDSASETRFTTISTMYDRSVAEHRSFIALLRQHLRPDVEFPFDIDRDEVLDWLYPSDLVRQWDRACVLQNAARWRDARVETIRLAGTDELVRGLQNVEHNVLPYSQHQRYELPDTYIRTYLPDSPSSIKIVPLNDENKLQAALDDSRSLNCRRLLALDLPEKEPSFNLARSIAELKDTPDALGTGREFAKFCHDFRDGSYVEFKPKGTNRVRIVRLDTPDLMCRTLVATYGPSPKVGSYPAVARSMDLKSVRVLRVRTAPLATVASLYLCWKFGVSQTVQDVDSVIRKGIRWAADCRRGLARVVSHLNTMLAFHSIGRSYSVTPAGRDMYERRGSKLPNGYRPFREQETTVPYIKQPEVETITICFGEHLRTYLRFGGMFNAGSWLYRLPKSGCPYVVDDNNIGLWLVPPDCEFYSNWEESCSPWKEVNEHNQATLDHLINRGSQIAHAEVVTTCTCSGRHWAKWSTSALRKALHVDDWTKALWSFEPLQVAWDLLPLSFVVEWFTNLRVLIESASKDLTRVIGKLAAPIQSVWTSLRVRLWAGSPKRDISYSTRGIWTRPMQMAVVQSCQRNEWFSDPSKVDEYLREGIRMHTVFSDFRLVIEIRKTGCVDVNLKKTRIRRFVRQKVVGLPRLPTFRMRCNLNLGKLFSLAALTVARSLRPKLER